MKLPKIFNATFEGSLAIEEDAMVQWQNKTIRQGEKKGRGLLMVFFVVVLILFSYGLIFTMNKEYNNGFVVEGVQVARHNFSPMWFFNFLLACYVLFWLVSHKTQRTHNRLFWMHMNGNNLLLLMGIEFVSLGLTILFPFFPLWIWLIVLLTVLCLIYMMLKGQVDGFFEILFGRNNFDYKSKSARRVKVLKTILYIGSILTVFYTIFKQIFPNIDNVPIQDGDVFWKLLFMIFFVILIAMIEIYTEFPLILQNYYHIKYAEEYRKHFGQSQVEWYGERYYRKHIKGTEKDDQVEEKRV